MSSYLFLAEAASGVVPGTGGGVWFPPQNSTIAKDVDWLFFYIYWLCVIFFFIIIGMAGYFVMKYRHRGPNTPKADHTFTHSNALELIWSVIPCAFLVPMFYWGFTGYMDLRTPPAGAYEIRVTAMKWQWLFTYPNGVVLGKLVVPQGQAVKLTMTSEDVLHSLFIPVFRVKQDVVPGRYTNLWFNATQPGEFHLFCTEYCGTKHSDMITTVHVVKPEEFLQVLEDADKPATGQSVADWGKGQFAKFGCGQCHSIDGKAGIGPTLKIGADTGFGSTRKLADGKDQVMDENYVKESILMPLAKVRAGFAPEMPPYQGRAKDKHIDAIIEYMKTLK